MPAAYFYRPLPERLCSLIMMLQMGNAQMGTIYVMYKFLYM